MPWWSFTKKEEESEESGSEEESESSDEDSKQETIPEDVDITPDSYPIHAAVIERDLSQLKIEIEKLPKPDPFGGHSGRPINAWDHHGYTPLTLAILLGWEEGVEVLLSAGAAPRVKSRDGWTSMHEAISTSQRSIVKRVMFANMEIMQAGLTKRGPLVSKHLSSKPDFYMEIDWKFVSWIPFVSRFCPSDTFKIWKRGSDIRVDISLIDFENYSWKRGHVSFLFMVDPGMTGEVTFHILNHTDKTRQISNEKEEFLLDAKETDQNVETLLQSECITPELLTDEIKIEKDENWLGRAKTVSINGKDCQCYKLKNLTVLTRRKNNHVPDEVKEEMKEKKKLLKKKTKQSKAGKDEAASGASSAETKSAVSTITIDSAMDPAVVACAQQTPEPSLSRKRGSASMSLSAPVAPKGPFAFAEDEIIEDDARTGRRGTFETSMSGRRAKSPRPWDRKKNEIFEKLRYYEYPPWIPVDVSLETYFSYDMDPLRSAAQQAQQKREEAIVAIAEAAAASSSSSSAGSSGTSGTASLLGDDLEEAPRSPAFMRGKVGSGGDSKKKKKGKFSRMVRRSKAEESEDESSSESSDSDDEKTKYIEKSKFTTTSLLNPAPVEVDTRTFSLNLAMVDKFGVSLQEVITILEAAGPRSKLAAQLVDFLKIQMPPGFPIRLELPLFYVLKAIVTFDEFREMKVPAEIFAIPEDYEVIDLHDDVDASG